MTDNATPLDIDNILHDFAVHIHPYAIGRGKPDDYEKYKAIAKSFINQYVTTHTNKAIQDASEKPKPQEQVGGKQVDTPGEISDGYHTFNELYEFRLLYNAALFNEWAKHGLYKVHKSWHHADEPYDSIFGKGWFIVVAELPTGQISNHYPPEDWELFQVTETPVAHAWDDHTTADVADRLRRLVQVSDLATNSPETTDGSSNPPLQALINKAVIKELEQLDPYERCDTFCDVQCDHAGKVIQERLKELRDKA